jgi:3-hydroxyisobutyrate dehydrogenase-like beta-hydroxyacid dehydrogenase
MIVGIAGLGLIGGSLAKAYKRRPDITVYGWNRNRQETDIAKISGAIDGELGPENIGKCDLIWLPLSRGNSEVHFGNRTAGIKDFLVDGLLRNKA